MSQPQYAIMRFAKYKGPEISNIEAHNERTKEKYASNPDIDRSRSKYNFHLIEPAGRYRAEAEHQISAAGCRTRTDSVRVVEAMFTATPEFFKGKKLPEVRRYFEEALRFFEQYQSRETIISAVVHMDEKTPHMHLSFVPLTADGRLSAKEIVGSASQTGRDHIPPRIFKEMTHLNKQRQKLEELLTGIGPLNSKKRAAEISKLLDGYIPAVEKIHTQLKKYNVAFTETTTENKRLKKKATELEQSLEAATKTSVLKKLRDVQLRRDYEDALALLERIPKEVIEFYQASKYTRKDHENRNESR